MHILACCCDFNNYSDSRMNIIDAMELCERQHDIAESRMEVCYEEADMAEDPLWVDFNMVEGDIWYKEVKLWSAIIGALALIEDIDS